MTDWDIDLLDWYPWRTLQDMHRRMSRLLADVTDSVLGTPFPPVNVWTNDEKAVVTAELPGVKKEDLNVSVERDVLTISGSREPERLQEGESYRRHERGHGSFARNVSLPFAVDAENVTADLKDGVLSVTLPRTEASKPRRIQIKG